MSIATAQEKIMRKEFKLTERQKMDLLDACKPTCFIIERGLPPISREKGIMLVWEEIGKEVGFNHETVKSVRNKSNDFFTAEVMKQS